MTPSAATRMAVPGIHHITAVASSAADNLDFYSRVLGLRLVKRTVNFDDPYTYHLYYGDQQGRPGTILTFFPWEGASPGRLGAGMLTAVAFAVPAAALDAWCRRLADHEVAHEAEHRFGERVIRFADPHGLALELIGTPWAAMASHQASGAAPAIAGFHAPTLLVHRLDATAAVITGAMGMVPIGREADRWRFGMRDRSAPGHLLDVRVDPAAPRARPGGGTVHHIAFRTADARRQQAWQHHLRDFGLTVTDVRDRRYFQSIYFHEPSGVLCEIATDPPGFAVDEAPGELGTALKLPPQYEPLRKQIEARLPPLAAPIRRSA